MTIESDTKTNNYQPYFVRDGRFIGDFEEMYRQCDDPWHQDAIQPVAEDFALGLLGARRYERILDLGCGKGRLTQRLKMITSGAVTAVDISPTAVQIAKARYPGIEFMADAIPPLRFPDGSFDLVVTGELLWYLLPKLPELLGEIRRVLKPGGHYLAIQQFYQPGEQSYGNEIMEAPEDCVAFVKAAGLTIVRTVELDRWVHHKFVLLAEASA